MNLQSQNYLAKLLAKENLSVRHGNYQTASFDVTNRILRLPLWADQGKDVYDLLVGHEVGHALYTPADGWHESDKEIPGVPRSMINIIEDIRIEKKIQETYPGITRAFKTGYKKLFDTNIFGTVGEDISTYGFMDRLNIHAKGRGYPEAVMFSDTEQLFVDLAMSVDTWDDVLNACQEISDYLNNKENYDDEQENSSEARGPEGDQSDEVGSEVETRDDAGEDDGEQIETPQGGGSSGEVEEEENEELISKTDDAQRENSDDLLETDEYDGRQPIYSSGMSDTDIKKATKTYAEVKALREEHDYYDYNAPHVADAFKKALDSGITKTVNLMAKEFERKKAAWEYSRSAESKGGSLNTNKLHQYQYSEDIFKTVHQLAQSKSHGVFMLIDFSGSMDGILTDVINQTITIALFCKKVGIPFEAYTFTAKGREKVLVESDKNSNAIQNDYELIMNEVIPSNVKKQVFMEAVRSLWLVGQNRNRYSKFLDYYMISLARVDSLGTTPLLQALIVTKDLVVKFRMKHKVQNMNTMILTDGLADTIWINNSGHLDRDSVNVNNKIIQFDNKQIVGESMKQLTASALKLLGELTESKVIGFFLAESKRDMYWGYQNTDQKTRFDEDEEFFQKDNLVHYKNTGGYHEYFIVKISNSKKSVENENEFEVKENKNGSETKVTDIRRQFRKFNKDAKKSKVLVNKITDAVAA